MEERKSISISKATHSRVKGYCDKHALKIFSWIDNIIREKLDNLNHK